MTLAGLDARELHDLLRGNREIALIDLREEGVFAEAHILRAANMPYSHLEMEYRHRIPRPSTPIVLVDDGDGLADRAAAILSAAGWCDLHRLDGGNAAWEAAGYPLFSGVNVPSKAFGEYIEKKCRTPHIGATDLRARIEAGEEIAILDSRPFEEFNHLSIPGGVNVPGAELVYRMGEAVDSETATVVVNCAGRTRSIIGAQSLIEAGVPNPVHALENGTMGWMLAGLEPERDADAVVPQPNPIHAETARERARAVASRYGVDFCSAAEVRAMQAESDRTTYLFDVRTAREYQSGHLPGSRHAPGGQLIQATDEYAPVINARIVLIDDAETRALMTASWLRRMGWRDVFVLKGADMIGHAEEVGQLETGTASETVTECALLPITPIEPDELAALSDVPVLDLSTSLEHEEAHVPGARFVLRSRLKQDLSDLARERLLVFTSREDCRAILAAQDLARCGIHRARYLKGGLPAWQAAGHPVETGMTDPLSPPVDLWRKPYQGGPDATAMQAYLDWETALLPLVEADGTLQWPKFDDDGFEDEDPMSSTRR